MFFQWLGQFVRRTWFFWLAAWVLLVVGTKWLSPPWNQVAQTQELAFLPANAPSRIAGEMYSKAFPDDRLSSTIVLVLSRSESEKVAIDQDLKYIENVVEPGLRDIAKTEGGLAADTNETDEDPLFGDEDAPAKPKKPDKRSIIARIRTPNAPGSGALLISPDGRAALVVLELTTEFLSRTNWPTIQKVEDFVANLKAKETLPAGLDINLTGSAVIGRDQSQAELKSARATELLTVVLVIALLVGIYRAPLLAIIPLLTVYLTVQLALNLLGILGDHGYIRVFQSLRIYITILTYGAGVDYCLFLTARYQEELDKGVSPAEAVAHAVRGVGLALAASVATVMFGIGMMMFAEFGKFREAGFAIPLSLALVLCATLTFSASLLRMAGRYAFWPRKASPTGRNEPVPESPGWFQAGSLERAWDKVAHLLMRRAGTVWLTTVAIMAPFAIAAIVLYDRISYDMVGNLPADAPSVAGTKALKEHFPAGMIGEVTVLLVQPKTDFGAPQGRAVVEQVANHLREMREELGLADIRSLVAPLGITEAAKRGEQLKEIKVDPQTRREATERAARERYTTSLGERNRIGTRINLTLVESPFARWSMSDLARIEQAIREALPENKRADAQLYFTGTTASVRDLASVMQRDRTRIEILVLASVLVILIVLLRQFVVSVYLLLSVLFSYYVTLGVAFAVFWMLDPHGFNGIDWKVAIFLFTILIAVGEDYNIFLIARIHEEEKIYGKVKGITHALTRTGPIISSCGIIMAGTFASLLAASLAEMRQLGFALAFGVLLDTFVVRPILVPAFLLLLANGRVPFLGKGKTVTGSSVDRPSTQAMSGSS